MYADIVSLLFLQGQIVELLPDVEELVRVLEDGLALGGAAEVEVEKAQVFTGGEEVTGFVWVVVHELVERDPQQRCRWDIVREWGR